MSEYWAFEPPQKFDMRNFNGSKNQRATEETTLTAPVQAEPLGVSPKKKKTISQVWSNWS